MHNLSYDIYGHIGSKTPRIFLLWCFAAKTAYSVVIILPLILHALADTFFAFFKSDFWIKNAGRVPCDAFFGKIIGLEAPYVMAGAKAVILTVLFDFLVNLVNDSEVFFGHFHGIVTEVSATFHHGIKNIVHNVL